MVATLEQLDTATLQYLTAGMGYRLGSYKPLPAARAFHKSPAKFRLLFGGNRSGKSEANMGAEVAALALHRHNKHRLPEKAVIWACTQTWEMVGKIIWQDKLSSYIPPGEIEQIHWHNKRASIPKEVRLRNGNVIEFKAYEQGRELFQGRSVDHIACDEQMPEDIFIECQARLMDRRGSFSLSATPIEPQPWLEARIDAGLATDEVFYANLNDNRKSRDGYIPDAEIDAMIAQWPDEVVETRVKGRFASFYGAVYKGFDRRIHVIDHVEPPAEGTHYRAIDFGFNNPFVCLWGVRNSDTEWYIYDEHYHNQSLLKYHAEIINGRYPGRKYRATYADHDAQGRAELKDRGIATKAAKKAVNEGIEKVQQALKVQGNGRPRLVISRRCSNLIREFPGYRYPEGTNKKDPSDEPMKLNDHTLDATRYMIYSAEKAGAGIFVGTEAA